MTWPLQKNVKQKKEKESEVLYMYHVTFIDKAVFIYTVFSKLLIQNKLFLNKGICHYFLWLMFQKLCLHWTIRE